VSDAGFIREYFDAERFGALLFLLAGALAFALAVLLLRRRSGLRGMAVPLVVVALVQLGVGYTVWQRSPAQAATSLQQLREAPATFLRVERARMRTVIADLQHYRSLELGLLALGMVIVVLLRNRAFWFAFGLGLVLQAALLLALDHVAQARARAYFEALQHRSTAPGL
jgi:hypothetical protein